MQIQQFEVINPVLKPYIGYYYLLSTEGDKEISTYQAFPSVNTPVCFFNDCAIRIAPQKAVVEKIPGEGFSEIIVGNAVSPLQVSMRPGVKEFCIVFKPLGINHTQTIRLGEILRNDFTATNLFTGLKDIVTFIINRGEGIEMLEEKLLSELRQTQELNNLQKIIQLLYTDENITFGSVSGKIFLSGKSIYRLFRSHLGISPVQFRSIIKFRNAVAKGIDPSFKNKMSAIALDSGYYDQANLINEVKKITRLSPKNFLSAITLYADKKIAWKVE